MHIIIIRYLAKIWLCGKMYVFGNIAGVAERHAYNYYPVSDPIFVLRLLAMIGFFSVTFHLLKYDQFCMHTLHDTPYACETVT